MSDQYFNPQATRKLIACMTIYCNDLNDNIKVLNEAANVCDQAMGSDDISKKYIQQLRESIDKMLRAKELTENAILELTAELKDGVDII